MGARLLWEQEDFGSTPKYPTKQESGFRLQASGNL